MVNGFSPLALTCGMLVVLSGSITAWTHLNPLSSLWTTPYGYALITKVCLAGCVFALGAWNWKRQRPQLGSESAALTPVRAQVSRLTSASALRARWATTWARVQAGGAALERQHRPAVQGRGPGQRGLRVDRIRVAKQAEERDVLAAVGVAVGVRQR